MKKKIIFILIEKVKRELDAKTLFALRAVNKNFRVIIGHKGNIWNIFDKCNPGLVLLKSFGPRNTSIIDFLKKEGFLVYSNDEEIILAWNMKERIELRMKNKNLIKIDKLLTVGNIDTEEIINQFPEVSKNIKKIGNLRLDLLKNKNNLILEEQSNLIKQKFGNFVLFATQFSKVNLFRKTDDWVDSAIGGIVNFNLEPKSKTVTNLYDQITMQREVLIETLDFLNFFEKKFPNKKLIITPHPVENKIFWSHYLKKKSFKNIYLNNSENFSTNALIKASEFVISTNSTSLLEAFILEKKIINFLGKIPRDVEIDVLKQVSNVVRSSEELKTLIQNEDKILKKNPSEELKNTINNLEDNKDSMDILLNIIENEKNLHHFKSIFKNQKVGIETIILNKFREFKSDLKKLLKLRKNNQSYLDLLHKDKIGDNFTHKSFFKRVQKINKIEKVKNLKFKQVLPEVFLLDRE